MYNDLLTTRLSSVKMQKANFKTEVKRKQSTPNFLKNKYFLLRVRNVCFSENLVCFVFLPPFWDSLSALPFTPQNVTMHRIPLVCHHEIVLSSKKKKNMVGCLFHWYFEKSIGKMKEDYINGSRRISAHCLAIFDKL